MSTEESWKTNRKLITQGHVVSYDKARFKTNGELWGLAVHPFAPIFMTAGDDKYEARWRLAPVCSPHRACSGRLHARLTPPTSGC